MAGLESRRLDPLEPGCQLPTQGAGRVRVANLIPADQHVDFCIRSAGGAYGRPVLRGGGLDCPAGYAYEDVSTPFAAPAGQVDVKAIASGQTCAAPALAERLGIDVPSDAPVTVVLMGPDASHGQLEAYPERAEFSLTDVWVRFIHAAAALGPIHVGIPKAPQLPTEVSSFVFPPSVPYASASPANAVTGMDARGYMHSVSVGAILAGAVEGSTKAAFLVHVPPVPTNYSFFAIGASGDTLRPVRALLCNDSPSRGLKADCTESELASLSIDVFSAGLVGATARFEDQRRPYIVSSIAARDSDIMCVTAVLRGEDRNAIIDAAKSRFPYNAHLTTTLDTPPTDPADQKGAIPPAPTAPPCSDNVTPQELDAVYQCFANNCSTLPGDQNGVLAGGSVDCLLNHCSAPLSPLYFTPTKQPCLNCILAMVTGYESYATSRQMCGTNVNATMPFDGQDGTVILSRYPLANTEGYIFPATSSRRTAVYTQVQLEAGATVDYYCVDPSAAAFDGLIPYTGAYANGDQAHGYAQEGLWHVKKVVPWIQKKSGNRPAIVSGTWSAGAAYFAKDGTTKILEDLNPDVVSTLRAAFVEAIAPDWTPACTYCPSKQNSYNGDFLGVLDTGSYLFNWPDNATKSQQIIFNDPVVRLPDGTNGMVSRNFGVNVRVVRP